MEKVLWILVIFFAFVSCEKDDVCDEKTTPKLIIGLFDSTEKPISIKNITVYSDRDLIYDNKSVDSLTIPLNITKNLTTIIIKRLNKSADTLNINYKKKEKFVSKACGFKNIFEQINIVTTTHDLIKFKINKNSIENEDSKHINIYY